MRRIEGWLLLVLLSAPVLAVGGGEPGVVAELARLDVRLAEQPQDLAARRQRADLRAISGQPMGAFLDRRALLLQAPGDSTLARLAAYDLAAAGAPEAAAAFAVAHPSAVAGEEGQALSRQLAGDVASRHVRWGWDEPVFDPTQRRHEAVIAIATLEPLARAEPADLRARGDLLLAYRLAERMSDAVQLWESALRRDEAPYWLRNAAADAYLALRRPAEAETLYRGLAEERPGTPQPWLGLYWASIEQREFGAAATALEHLREVPGQELVADVQRGWLLLYADRTVAGRAAFEELYERHPGNPGVRQGLASATLWQGQPRAGLRASDELLARTTLASPRVDNPTARIGRAGALSSLGEVSAARREAADLTVLYPDNVHAQRLSRDLSTQRAPEARLDGRYDTSDRGLGESWTQAEASAAVGTRLRLAGGVVASRAEDDRYVDGDVRQGYLGLSGRPARDLALSAEAGWDLSGDGFDRPVSLGARLVWTPADRWRVDAGYSDGGWRDLPVRARAEGLVADTLDLGASFTPSPRWNARVGAGRSTISDGNERTWGLLAGRLLAREGPLYRAWFGAEAYASGNQRSDVPYFSPRRDSSFALTHRSEWVVGNGARRRHGFSLLANAGVYAQDGYDSGAVGGLWLESDWDLSGRTGLVVGVGARSQLYDGIRELDPRVYVTARQRF